MGKIVAGMASSHAFALSEPSSWDQRRNMNMAMYARRYGQEPPIHPKVAQEIPDERLTRYKRVRDGLTFLRETLKAKKPDVLLVIGDDQNEHFKDDNVPQIAIYTGDSLYTTERIDGRREKGPGYRCHSELAQDLLSGLVEREFDVSFCRSFPNDELLAHAHAPIMRTVVPDADIPVVPIFVNAIHVPAPSPSRCYRLGQAMQQIIVGRPSGERVAIYASGGLSHFTGGYPYKHYTGPYTYGSISEEFDRKCLDLMSSGQGGKLAELTSKDLLDNGDIEMRSWIVLLGAVGDQPARVLAYEPFYSGIMGMGVAYWEAERSPTSSGSS